MAKFEINQAGLRPLEQGTQKKSVPPCSEGSEQAKARHLTRLLMPWRGNSNASAPNLMW